jgi:hypothetical protein
MNMLVVVAPARITEFESPGALADNVIPFTPSAATGALTNSEPS